MKPSNEIPEPGRQETQSDPWRDRLLRAALFALCLLLSAEALAIVSRWRANRDMLSEILSRSANEDVSQAPSGEPTEIVRTPTAGETGDKTDDITAAIRRVAFERTPHHAKLTVARTLVYQAMTAGDGGSPEAGEHLPVARELALEVLSQQPNSWQALMFQGAATYLEWSLRSDRRLYTAAAQWEQPLLAAMEQARGQPEPRRFLAAAYLETWPALSEAKKALALELLKALFREDAGSFDRLGPVWLEVAGDLESALAVIPDQASPWRTLEASFAQKREWDLFSMARRRYLKALRRQLSEELEEAAERLRLGDLGGARQMCLAVVVNAPRDGTFADLVSRALELYPPGLHGRRMKDTLKSWLHWALELDAIGKEPFSPRAIRRLTDAIGELDPPTGALAALIADDALHVERYKKLADTTQRKEWAPFLIAETGWLIERQNPEDLEAAVRALGDVHRSARASAAYWSARRQLARATGDLSDLATADQRLAELRSDQWRVSDWRWQGRQATLKLHAAGRGTGLELTIARTPPRGAVAELIWDGSSIAMRPVKSRQTIELAVDVTPGPHLLELRSLAGGEIEPGEVRLLLAPGERGQPD